MKRLICIILTLMLCLTIFSGCQGENTESGGDNKTVVSGVTAVSSNEASDTKSTPQKPDLSDIIINGNYTTTGDPQYTASDWVRMWLDDACAESSITDADIEFQSSAVYYDFSDNFQLSPMLYNIRSEKPVPGAEVQPDGTYALNVLVVTVVENDKTTLSGFAAPYDASNGNAKQEVYDVASKDPRYSSRLAPYQNSDLPEGFTQLDMELVSGGRNAIGPYTKILPGEIIATVCSKTTGEGSYSYGVSLFDLVDRRPCGYVDIGEYSINSIKVSEGKLVVTAIGNDWSSLWKFYIDSKGNMITEKLTEDMDNALYSPDGKRYAYSSKGSLYAADVKDNIPKLLAEGNATENTDTMVYYPYAWADNSRLVYSIGGYEWSNGCGIIDVTDGKDTSFKNIYPNAAPCALVNGKLYIMEGVLDAYFDPWVVDLEDPQYPYKKVFKSMDFTVSTTMDSYVFSPDGTKIAVLKPEYEKDQKNVLYICSAKDGSILKSYEFKTPTCRPCYLDFFEDGRIAIYSEECALCPCYMYMVDIG